MDNIIRLLIPVGMYLLVLGLLYSKRVNKWMIGLYVKVEGKARLIMERVKSKVDNV